MKKFEDKIIEINRDFINNREALPELVDAYFARDSRIVGDLGVDEDDHSQLVKHFQSWYLAFPNSDFTSMRVFKESDHQATLMFSVEGCHENEFASIPATGKTVLYGGYATLEFDKIGKIIKWDYQVNMVNLYNQLGHYMEQERYPGQGLLKADLKAMIDLARKCGSTRYILTKKQVLCLALSMGGCSSKEIATLLDRSPRTSESHLSEARARLNCCCISQAAELIKAKGLKFLFRDIHDSVISTVDLMG